MVEGVISTKCRSLPFELQTSCIKPHSFNRRSIATKAIVCSARNSVPIVNFVQVFEGKCPNATIPVLLDRGVSLLQFSVLKVPVHARACRPAAGCAVESQTRVHVNFDAFSQANNIWFSNFGWKHLELGDPREFGTDWKILSCRQNMRWPHDSHSHFACVGLDQECEVTYVTSARSAVELPNGCIGQ